MILVIRDIWIRGFLTAACHRLIADSARARTRRDNRRITR